MKSFDGKKLSQGRKAAQHTQKSLAEVIGTSERMVRKWEGGEAEPTASYLLRAMELLGCAPGDLLTDNA